MRRVVKIGGSLLVRPDLVDAINHWLSRQPTGENVFIVGGGELINAMRDLDHSHSGDPAGTHWLCVELLDVTRKLFSNWSGWPCLETSDQLTSAIEKGFPIDSPTLVAVSAYYTPRHCLGTDIELPQDWSTTTDAIAGLLASLTSADELILLKSCDVDPGATLEQLAQQGIVDTALPMIESKLGKIRIEKLS